MRVFGYLLFSLLLSAALSLAAGEMFDDALGFGYFLAILIALALSIFVGTRMRLTVIDIAAVNSFTGFALCVQMTKSYSGALATILAILLVAVLCVSSVYLFLRILGWVGPYRD